MARVTIIVEDGVVGVDGEFKTVDLSSMREGIRAVQWYGGHGEIEWDDGSPNQKISSFDEFRPLLNAWRGAEAS